jgi:imidazoleglycerol phosphate dehydratase HisB
MDEIKYEKIGEVNGRWKADIIESFLVSQGITVQLVQGAITHHIYKGFYDLVQIFVPNIQANTARELLNSFEEFKLDEEED